MATPFSASQEAMFSTGNSVGLWAQKRFPRGKDATPAYFYDFGPSIQKTKDWINAGEKVIYEAAFISEGVLAALDLYIQKGSKRIALEVKSSTSLRDYHLQDAALQYWIMKNAGFAPDEFYLMHINNQYVREGALNPKKLFSYVDITEQIKAKQEGISEDIKTMKAVLLQKEIPERTIGPQCNSPFDCEFKDHCWQHIPENSIFDLSRIGKKAWECLEQGIVNIKDITAVEEFSERQQVEITGVQDGKSCIDKQEIQSFLKEWQYPLYFFDFESINPALPVYQGTSPFQQIPVQYSLHVLEQPGAEIKHLEFLADFTEDPREALIQQMLLELGKEGSIVTYNMSFEKSIIDRLALDFPGYSAELTALSERLVDLLIPFRNSWYYTPEMKGSASIKTVLPALCPNDRELDYKALDISNGGDASNTLKAFAEETVPKDEIQDLRKDLLAYCKLDTLAMVKIWEVLARI